MYNIRWLAVVAREGLADLAPAIRQAFNDNPHDDRLALVFGTPPRRNILLLTLAGLVAGLAFGGVQLNIPFGGRIDWPAVVLAALYALCVRRYLFGSDAARDGDFPWLAASMAPAVAVLALFACASTLVAGPQEQEAAAMDWISTALVALTHGLGVAAAFVIAVAALCFSRRWPRALMSLAIQLLVFNIMVFVTTLVLLEIGIVGPIVSGLVHALTGLSLPDWLGDLIDALSYAGLLGVVYLAVIGATWTVCRQRFGQLLESGEVDVVSTVVAMAQDPERAAKKAAKKQAKLDKKARKAAAKTKQDSDPPSTD